MCMWRIYWVTRAALKNESNFSGVGSQIVKKKKSRVQGFPAVLINALHYTSYKTIMYTSTKNLPFLHLDYLGKAVLQYIQLEKKKRLSEKKKRLSVKNVL